MKKALKFLADFIEDIFIVLGILLIVAATLLMFGLEHSMYVLGGFLIILGVVDPHFLRK
jgi:hypothetical protein